MEIVMSLVSKIFVAGFCLMYCNYSIANNESINIAVAANFKPTLEQLLQEYKRQSPKQKITLSSASSGVLYAQIINGAPFDIFMSADSLRPELLEDKKLIKPDSRLTYALGKLALWAPNAQKADHTLLAWNGVNGKNKIAVANPTFAPFGMAAEQVLSNLNVLSQSKGALVKANNVAQVFQMVSLGAVEMGFVAEGQIQDLADPTVWIIPQKYYQPIVQQMVLINQSKQSYENKEAERFYQFLQGEQAKGIIQQAGYDVPINQHLVSR